MEAGSDPRICNQLLPSDDLAILELAMMINQKREVNISEKAVEFCINVMRYNESIMLSDLVGKDMNARDKITKRMQVEQIAK